ncbi:hypothetical protein [Streptobacillus notomytis]|uniref:hypothetical protein n=1 Tax=Streptobacillus notomytis TaxID=1712031 RepID=UPI00082B1D5E|nr:hypothetical protein [Streptobacillus notomytis]
MKKMFLLSFLSLIALSNVNNFNKKIISKNDKNNFEIVSTKYTYFHSINSKKEKKYYEDLMYKIDFNKADKFKKQVEDIEKIFSRVFKSEKNLVPKIIKYIYFEPVKTNDKSLIDEQIQKIMVAFNANSDSVIYINNTDNNAEQFLDRIYSRANKDQILLFNDNDKDILNVINEQIKKDNPEKNNFSLIEVRVLIITASSKIKEKLALSKAIFNKDLKGVEIDDFSYLDKQRYLLDTTDQETREKTFKSFINGIY